jgi:hypothetical protein
MAIKYDKILGAVREKDFDSSLTSFPVTGFIMVDSNGTRWRITIDTTGALVSNIMTGSPMGMLLTLTYS